jgi:hypothetical protein
MILPLAHKKVNFVLEGMVGRGIGRYGDSLQTDATFRPDGSISPIKNLRGTGGFEIHATPKLDWYIYGGDEYLGRNFYATGTGYGNPLILSNTTTGNAGCFAIDSAGASCSAATRNLIEGDTGFWYTMYKGGYGTFKFGAEYSWIYKTTWQDASGATPRASDSMAYTALRYYLP